jgi:hypothetical protein
MYFFALFPVSMTAAGFQTGILHASSHIDLKHSNSTLWIRIDPPSEANPPIDPNPIFLTLPIGKNWSTPIPLNDSIFYQVHGDGPRLINSGTHRRDFTYLVDDELNCGLLTVGLSSASYISVTSGLRSTDTICYFFYDPEASYRITFNCNASKTSWCSVWSQESLLNRKPEDAVCEGSEDCDVTLSDGFVGRSWNASGLREDKFTIDYIKGARKPFGCKYDIIGLVNTSGYFPLTVEGVLTNICEKPVENYVAAVIMVGTLIGGLVCAIVIYRLCRPSREPTQGDDEDTWRILPPMKPTGRLDVFHGRDELTLNGPLVD